jgi:heptosyltransferase II
MKIAVIQPKMIGDVLVTSVIFVKLREKFPDATLHYIINQNTADVVLNNPNIDKLILIDPKNEKGFFGFKSRLKKIKAEQYDIIIDSYAKLKTALLCYFSGAKKTISFKKKYSSFFYTDTLVRNKKSFSAATKAIEHRLLLLEPLGINFEEVQPKIYLTPIEIEKAKKALIENNIDTNKPVIMISALGSSDAKTYPLIHMAKVLDKIAEFGAVQILLNYIPHQKETVLELFSLCKEATKTKLFIDFYATSLLDFMGITAHCQALIGNEGGATNIAKAINIPTFTIFSPKISKTDWNMFENGTTNVSVHVSDYLKIEKVNKKNLPSLYLKFNPELFMSLLKSFIDFNIEVV